MNSKHIIQVLPTFSKKKILVLGDIMLDEYIYGKVDRISPEAPVPVLNATHKTYCLGGAANVAFNVNALGAKVFLVGIIGTDSSGKKCLDLLKKKSLNTHGIYISKYRRTTLKTRVLSNQHQMLRVDEEDVFDTNETELNQLQSTLKRIIEKEKIDAVIIEDYDKGCLSPFLIDYVTNLCKKRGVLISVDPKRKHFFDYKNVSLFKPNLKETRDALGINIESDLNGLKKAYTELYKRLKSDRMLITLSKSGVFYAQGKNSAIIPAFVRSISDVSGAGDTVISVATLAMLAGLSMAEVAWISNLAGGLVCEKPGVDVISLQELKHEIQKISA